MQDQSIPMEYMHALRRLGQIKRMHACGDIAEGFTDRDFMFLHTIELFHCAHPDVPGPYVNDLARHMRITKSAASKTLQQLEQRGLIERSVDPHNRRNTFVSMTAAGRTFNAQQREKCDRFFDRVAQRVGEQRMRDIIRGMNELAQAMQEETERMCTTDTRRKHHCDRFLDL